MAPTTQTTWKPRAGGVSRRPVTEPVPIPGVRLLSLPRFPDARGELSAIFSAETASFVPRQWNTTSSQAGVLRGVHVHLRRSDYVCALVGECVVGLHDLRRSSASFGRSHEVELRGDEPIALEIPAGVAHAFAQRTAGIVLVGLDVVWEASDDLACRWDSPGLGLFSDLRNPILSPRDANAPSLDALVATLEPQQAALWPE